MNMEFPDGDTGYFHLIGGVDDWSAGFYWYETPKIDAEGKTPEEAVSRLWLALNKK